MANNLPQSSLKIQAIKTALNGEWKNAIELNKTILQTDPDDIDTLNRLGLAYAVIGDLNNAKKTYQKVSVLDPLNMIAMKNLKKLSDKKTSTQGDFQINCNFLEETGKTKVVELVNIAQPNIIQLLRIGQTVELSIKRSKIFVLNCGQYLGVLPDDIGNRLIKFMKSGNRYEAYVKCSNQSKVQVFLKEVKRANRYRNQPSFMSISESVLDLEKPKKIKISDSDEPESED